MLSGIRLLLQSDLPPYYPLNTVFHLTQSGAVPEHSVASAKWNGLVFHLSVERRGPFCQQRLPTELDLHLTA